MRCEYDPIINRTICAYFVLNNADMLGPYFEITMNVEYATGFEHLQRNSKHLKIHLLKATYHNLSRKHIRMSILTCT